MQGLRVELAEAENAIIGPLPRVHPNRIQGKLARLDELLRQHPLRARAEIEKHLDGDLVITPRPSGAGERRGLISGAVKSNSLLANQEAVCPSVVAGGRLGRGAPALGASLLEFSFHGVG